MIRMWLCVPALVLCATSCISMAGCAQNQEPVGSMAQTNVGPESPQRGTIINYLYAGDVYYAGARPPTATSPADVLDEDRTALAASTNAELGLATAQGPRNGRVHVLNLWQDQSGVLRPTTGAMSPTGTMGQTTEGTQEPQTQVNPAMAVGLPGSAVSASSSGTAGFGSGPVTGAPNTVSPAQSPLYTNVVAPANSIGTILELLGGWFRQLANNAAGLPAGTQPAP